MRYKPDHFASEVTLHFEACGTVQSMGVIRSGQIGNCVHGIQVFVPTVKPQADDGDFYRSFAPYRVLELFVCLFAGW